MASRQSRPDGGYSLVDVDRETRSEAETVRAMHRQTFTAPRWLVVAIITAATSIVGTYIATHQETRVTPGLTKDQFDESMRMRDEQINRRFDGLETDMSYLKVTVRIVQDRIPPQK